MNAFLSADGQLPRGPGMPVRWLAGLMLMVAAVVVPYAIFGAGSAGIMALIQGDAGPAPETAVTAVGALGSATDTVRGLAFFVILTVVWLLVFHRRPSVWPKIVLWSGFLMAAELLLTGIFGLLFVFGSSGFANPLAILLFVVAAPIPPVLCFVLARAAQQVMGRPLSGELANSVVEVAYRSRPIDTWVLLQFDRIAQAPSGRRTGQPKGVSTSILWPDVQYLQLGQVADGSTFHAPGPVLRVVGGGRQWLLPVDREHGPRLLAMAVGKAERALADAALVKRVADQQADVAQQRAKAAQDVQRAATAVRPNVATGAAVGGPYGVLVVAIAGLTLAVISLFPGLVDAIYGQPTGWHVDVAGGVVFGVIGLLAAVMYRRYARGLRFLQSHADQAAAHTDPAAAPVPMWTPVTPPVYPRRPSRQQAAGVAE